MLSMNKRSQFISVSLILLCLSVSGSDDIFNLGTAALHWERVDTEPLIMNTSDRDELTSLITGMKIDPVNPDIMYIYSDTGGLWKSVDHGQTWMDLSPNLQSAIVSCIDIDVKKPNKLWVSTGTSLSSGKGLLFSEDGGASFTQVPMNLREISSVLAFNNLLFLPDTLQHSNDNGNNWKVSFYGIHRKHMFNYQKVSLNEPDHYLYFLERSSYTSYRLWLYRTRDMLHVERIFHMDNYSTGSSNTFNCSVSPADPSRTFVLRRFSNGHGLLLEIENNKLKPLNKTEVEIPLRNALLFHPKKSNDCTHGPAKTTRFKESWDFV